jgi:hypothetical protein
MKKDSLLFEKILKVIKGLLINSPLIIATIMLPNSKFNIRIANNSKVDKEVENAINFLECQEVRCQHSPITAFISEENAKRLANKDEIPQYFTPQSVRAYEEMPRVEKDSKNIVKNEIFIIKKNGYDIETALYVNVPVVKNNMLVANLFIIIHEQDAHLYSENFIKKIIGEITTGIGIMTA